MAQPDLTSHHVNYLIWRYVFPFFIPRFSNSSDAPPADLTRFPVGIFKNQVRHGDAAVSLQRAWFPDPQSLPFARHIKTHALVSLVQKGLQYHELESSLDKEGNPITFTPTDYFFGPEPFEANALKRRDDAGTDHPAEPARDRVTNGHSLDARPRKETNGDESMEVDDESKGSVDGDGDVSMGAEEQAPEPTLSTGSSAGVQISPAKAADLAPDTALLHANDHVMTTRWRPRDSTLLVAAGETSCSLWKLSLSSPPEQNRFLDLKGTSAYVSGVAWDAVGSKLAVATIRDMEKGAITMYNSEGNVVDLLPDLPRLISGLHWSDDSPQLVVVASDERSSELALWDDSRRPDVYPPPQAIDSHVYDLAWCGRNLVFACGDGAVYQCEVDSNIRLTKTFNSRDTDTAWAFVRSAHTSSYSVAVAASSTTSSIWIPTHDILIENAHQDAITAIDIRPAEPHSQQNSTITIASYSIDTFVHVWEVDLDSKQHKRIHRLRLGSSTPALAGSFSPDGYALCAVSQEKLFIWNAERGGEPMATWTAPSSEQVKEDPDHPTNGQNGHAAPVPDRDLSWDHDGKKLAYGFGDQMAIVNLQR
ncbi:hypothetical protein N7481_009903 [Penicillium waksmanii]|uniref:uncharacterized protein n=1 Tax=Penicillium waksmanii TaxID=69791 RepID=UPI002549531A|nr:uncharacterized protein N7481_009903 [Penicillium waksmanii]KAJ5976196.1 hypothetical protein N7481_009903 [Penicillium waksmanii]